MHKNFIKKEICKLLKNRAKCVNVPYKFNRAVLFNSDYFHETDKINFKDEYEARRINITYLFGDRLFKKNIWILVILKIWHAWKACILL